MAAQHVAVSISPDARDQVRALTFALTGATGRRVTMSQAIIAACAVADRHEPAELATYLPEDDQ